MYPFLRSVLFFFDPERVHYFSMNWLRKLCSVGFIRNRLAAAFTPVGTGLTTQMFGLNFKNPVGLAAGFDKNACYLRELEALGFGYVEIGTVTPRPQDGNEKPRLFRLKEDKALINRMGFNNDGVEAIATRLKDWRSKRTASSLIIGGNIGKNKVTPNEEAWMDYEICFNHLHDYVDYFVVNVSSPNTPGLRELQEKESLRKILTHLQAINSSKAVQRPLLLKIAPDLTNEQLDDVIDLALEIKLDGLVATNTTLDRSQLSDTGKLRSAEAGAGGLSGAPVRQRSTEIVAYMNQRLKGSIPVIASGGIFTAEHAREKRQAGSQLVQVWTGFIYEGPSIVKNICKGL